MEKTNLNPAEVGDIVVGTVLAPGSLRGIECRMAALYAGFPGSHLFSLVSLLFIHLDGFIRLLVLVLLACTLPNSNSPLSLDTVPIRTVNRQCSSGLQAVADVAAFIKAGYYDIGMCEFSKHIVTINFWPLPLIIIMLTKVLRRDWSP